MCFGSDLVQPLLLRWGIAAVIALIWTTGLPLASVPPAAGSGAQAHAATAACPQTLLIDEAVRVVNIRVSGMSCAMAVSVIRRYYRLSFAEMKRVIREFQRRGYAYALGYRFTRVRDRGVGYSLHGWRPGQNFYFTDMPPEDLP